MMDSFAMVQRVQVRVCLVQFDQFGEFTLRVPVEVRMTPFSQMKLILGILLYCIRERGAFLIDTVGARRCPQGCVAVVTFKGAIRWAMYKFG